MLSEFRQLDSLTTFITVTILDIFIDCNAPFTIWGIVISSLLRSWRNFTVWTYCLYLIRLQMSWILCLLFYLLDSYYINLYCAINQTYIPFYGYHHMHVALLKFCWWTFENSLFTAVTSIISHPCMSLHMDLRLISFPGVALLSSMKYLTLKNRNCLSKWL